MARKSRKAFLKRSAVQPFRKRSKDRSGRVICKDFYGNRGNDREGDDRNPVELMKNYVADTEDISVAEVYKDSDYSGTNFDRSWICADDGRYQAWGKSTA